VQKIIGMNVRQMPIELPVFPLAIQWPKGESSPSVQWHPSFPPCSCAIQICIFPPAGLWHFRPTELAIGSDCRGEGIGADFAPPVGYKLRWEKQQSPKIVFCIRGQQRAEGNWAGRGSKKLRTVSKKIGILNAKTIDMNM
jgi:hypothetical protein